MIYLFVWLSKKVSRDKQEWEYTGWALDHHLWPDEEVLAYCNVVGGGMYPNTGKGRMIIGFLGSIKFR